jgi:uncharacterized Zn finger protein (UPF0148 family)
MIDCPKCGSPVDGDYCPKCRYSENAVKKTNAPGLSRAGEIAEMIRQQLQTHGPTTDELTEQQWYNVCRFYPLVARRSRREFADVGPHNPLDATAQSGTMFKGVNVFDARALPPREPGEEG